jgi:hypothetical protein
MSGPGWGTVGLVQSCRVGQNIDASANEEATFRAGRQAQKRACRVAGS